MQEDEGVLGRDDRHTEGRCHCVSQSCRFRDIPGWK